MTSQPSTIWNYFRILRNENYAECDLCYQKISRGNRSKSTLTMWKHLSLKHPLQFQELKDLRSPSPSCKVRSTPSCPVSTTSIDATPGGTEKHAESILGSGMVSSSSTQSFCGGRNQLKNALTQRTAYKKVREEQEEERGKCQHPRTLMTTTTTDITKSSNTEGEVKMSRMQIKKPKMDQFVTFSNCSDPDDDVTSPNSHIPDEVPFQEVNPNLEVNEETADWTRIKTEPQEKVTIIESTSRCEGEEFPRMELDESDKDLRDNEEHPVVELPHYSNSEGRFSLSSEGHLTLSLEMMPQGGRIWSQFTRHPDMPGVAICNSCLMAIRMGARPMSVLTRHALIHSRERMSKDITCENSSVVEDSWENQSLMSTNESVRSSNLNNVSVEGGPMSEERSGLITEKLVQMMVKDYQPPSIVENPGFRDLMMQLEPKYQLPSASYFSKLAIPEMYNKVLEERKEEYRAKVRNATCSSLTVDRWTSSVGGSSYLDVICHQMFDDFTISHQFLTNKRLGGKQSGQDIQQTINDILEDWGYNISKLQVYIVTKNARELQSDASSTKCNWTVVQCFGHTLQMAIRDAMDNTPGYADVSRKARDIVHRLSNRPDTRGVKSVTCVLPRNRGMSTSVDEEEADLEVIKCGDLPMDHWIVEYMIMERLMKLEGIPFELELELEELRLAKSVVDVLKPIHEAMKDFCSLEFPPLSMTIPLIYGMEHMLRKALKEATTGTRGAPSKTTVRTIANTSSPWMMFTRNLLAAIRSWFPSYKTNRTSVISMVLDPRYKAVILSGHEVNSVARMVADEVMETTQQKVLPPEEKSQKEGGTGVSSLLWSTFEEVSREQVPSLRRKIAISQFKRYLEDPLLPRTSDPLPWWIENRGKYDLLAPVAMKYACIPALHVSGEQVIGQPMGGGGGYTNVRRLFLPETNMEQMVYLHKNLREDKLIDRSTIQPENSPTQSAIEPE